MITPITDSETGEVMLTARGRECRYCAGRIEDPAIMWIGFGDEPIFLHAACAADASLRVLRDVHEIERRTGTRIALAADSPAERQR